MIALTAIDRALTIVELASIARDRAIALWSQTAPARRAIRIYSRALWAGTKAAIPPALAAIATLAVLALALGMLAYQRGRAFRSWCDALVSAAEQQPEPAPAPEPGPDAIAPVPVPAITAAPRPIAAAVSAATLRKVCAQQGMPRAARATKAQCLEFLGQLAQSPQNPALSPMSVAGGWNQ